MEIINFLEDQCGQSAAEYILLFGGVIIIVLIAMNIYSNYFTNADTFNAKEDAQQIRSNLTNMTRI